MADMMQMPEQFKKFMDMGVQMPEMGKSMEEYAKFTKANFDAYAQCANLAAKGSEDIAAEWLAFVKQTMEMGVATAKDLSTVKSMNEAMTIQSDFTKDSFERYVEELSKISDMAIATARDAMEPLTERVAAAGELAQTATTRAA